MSIPISTRRAVGVVGWLIVAPLALWLPLGAVGIAPAPFDILGYFGLLAACAVGAVAVGLIKWSGLHG